jgi:UDP-N-acetylglucosamine acyltransferase
MTERQVHASAVLSPHVKLGPGVKIGPGCVLTGDVELGEGVELIANVYVQGPVKIGPRTRVWPNACIGADPQDYKVKPGFATAGVVVGADCLIRECVTIHSASKPDVATRLGDRVFMMAASHVGHDGHVHDDVVLVNNVLLAGHVEVFEKATIGGGTAIHQFCRVGRQAFLSGLCAIATEVPPYGVTMNRNNLVSINMVGMRRGGVAREQVTLARRAFREVFRKNLPKPAMIQRLTELDAEAGGPGPIREMLEFVRAAKRPICPYRGNPRVTGESDAE